MFPQSPAFGLRLTQMLLTFSYLGSSQPLGSISFEYLAAMNVNSPRAKNRRKIRVQSWSANLPLLGLPPSVSSNIYILCKGGQPANKFRKVQIRKFADLKNLLDLGRWQFANLPFLDPKYSLWFADLRSADSIQFVDLKLNTQKQNFYPNT